MLLFSSSSANSSARRVSYSPDLADDHLPDAQQQQQADDPVAQVDQFLSSSSSPLLLHRSAGQGDGRRLRLRPSRGYRGARLRRAGPQRRLLRDALRRRRRGRRLARRHVRRPGGRDARLRKRRPVWARGGGGGELAAASREGSSVSDPAWAYGANAKKLKAPAAGAAKGKEAVATFAKMGEAMGPDSKKCKIEDEMVRPKVEEEEATASDGSADRERGRKQDKGKGSKSKQSADDEPPRDYVHVRARRGQATDSHSLAERVRREKITLKMKMLQDLQALCDKKLKGKLAGKEKLIEISAKAAAQGEKNLVLIL